MPGSWAGVCRMRLARSLVVWLGCVAVVSVGLMSVSAPRASGASPPLGPADTLPPAGEIEYPRADSWVTYQYVGVRVHFEDPDGINPSSLAFQVDGTPLGVDWYSYDGGISGDASGYDGPFAEGSHRAEARAKDWLGNGPTVLSWSFSIDTIRPVVNITYPIGNPVIPDGSGNLTWTGSDVGSGIDYYGIRIDDGPYVNVGTATSFPFHDLAPGIHYFYVGATDVAGNSDSYYYAPSVLGVATVPRPTAPPANASTQVFVTVPDGMPSWAVALLTVNVAEAAAVAWLGLRGRRESHGGVSHNP